MKERAIYSTVDGLMSSLTSFLLVAITTRNISDESSESSFMLMTLFIFLGLQRSTLGFRTLLTIPSGSEFIKRIAILIASIFVYFYFAVYIIGNYIFDFSLSIWQVLLVCTLSCLQDYMRFTFASCLRYKLLIVYDAIPLLTVLFLFVFGTTGSVALQCWTISNVFSLFLGLWNEKFRKLIIENAEIKNESKKILDRYPLDGLIGLMITYLVIYVSHAADSKLGITLILMCISSYSVVNIFASSSLLWIIPFLRTKQKKYNYAKMFTVVFGAMISVNLSFFILYTIGNIGPLLYGSNFDYARGIMFYFALSSTFLAYFAFIGHYLKGRDRIKLVNQTRYLQVVLSIILFSFALKFRTLEAVAMAELVTSALICSISVLVVAKSDGWTLMRKQT
jgi:hypothetical protein